MKITKTQLRRIISEEMGAVLSLGGGLPVSIAAEMADPISLEEQMMGLLACLRCAGVWFHAAHQLTKGVGFAGDHVNIYGEIYDALIEDYDGAAEKAIGLTGNEDLACPHKILEMAVNKMEKYASPSGATASMIAGTALQIVKDLNSHVEETFTNLEASGQLALGLNDFLAAAANDYTRYVYLLQQRVKES